MTVIKPKPDEGVKNKPQKKLHPLSEAAIRRLHAHDVAVNTAKTEK